MSNLPIKEPEVDYIIHNGKKRGVVLTIDQYKALMQLIEDLRDIRSAEQRKKEPTVEYVQYRSKRLSRSSGNR